jgi:hypothetical protein
LCNGDPEGFRGYSAEDDDLTEAVVQRLQQITQEDCVRLLKRRFIEDGRVKYRLRKLERWE